MIDTSYLDSTLGFQLKRAQVAYSASVYRSVDTAGLTLVQFSVLSILHDNPGIAQAELARALKVERPRMVPIIDSLEQKGLAVRSRSANDLRRRELYLTAAGEQHLGQLQRQFDRHQQSLIELLGVEAFDKLIVHLRQLSELDQLP